MDIFQQNILFFIIHERAQQRSLLRSSVFCITIYLCATLVMLLK
jgi:hypothetical protein